MHTYEKIHTFRHPQAFVLASFGGIQVLVCKPLWLRVSLALQSARNNVLSARESLPLSSDWGFQRGGVASCCVLFKWVWSQEETAHELPHAANKRRNVESFVLVLHSKYYYYVMWREQEQWEDSVDSKTIRGIFFINDNFFVFIYKWLGKVAHIFCSHILCNCK